MFVDVFIRRPILSSVCSLVIILAGLVAIPTLPIEQYPQLSPPRVNVNAFYTGASAFTVESAVTNPLEQAINGVEGLQYITSNSTNSGTSTITATFELGRSADLAAVDVQNRVAATLGRLPNEVKNVGVTVTKATTGFVMGVGVYAEKNEYDTLFISNYLDVFVRDALKRVPGVADVTIFGERKYAMRVWLDPTRLASRGLTAADVSAALREQNVQIAAGAVGQPPAPGNQPYEISVRAAGRLTEPDHFEQVILKNSGGTLVRLRDVGRAEVGAETYASRLRFNRRDAVGVGVAQLPTANALDVYTRVSAELERLSKSFPPGLKYEIAFDNTTVISDSIREVLKTLLEAIALVVLVMFLFLQDWRATIIPTITIPVSLVGTFAFVYMLGFSINTLTLFGITLATGIVVDDAIVVIENIQRHIHEYGRTPFQAAGEAMGEVLGAVVATALVLIAVFVPVAFFQGTIGRFYQQFSLTIAFSVALSAFNALTLTPALSALLLRGEREKGMFFRWVERVIAAGTTVYMKGLRRFVRLRTIMVVLFLVSLGLTVAVYRAVPTGFVPDEDQNLVIMQLQAPEGASLDYSSNIGQQVEAVLQKEPAIRAVFSVMGFSFGGASPNRGMLFVRLLPIEQRLTRELGAPAVVGRLRAALARIPGAQVVPFLPPALAGVGTLGGFQFELLDQSGGHIRNLAQTMKDVIRQGNQRPDLRGLFATFSASDPQFALDIDREKLKALGMPLSEVSDTLQIFLGSQYVNDFDFNNRVYRVYVQADQQFRSSPKDLKQLYGRAASGQMVSLDSVVKIHETTAPQVISHFNLFRSAEITGSAAPGVSSGQALDAMEAMARRLPSGYSFAWAGQSLEEKKSGTQAASIFGLSVIIVYLVLSAQYESFVLPIIILLGVPLAIFGALGAQFARGFTNDVFCQVGLVLLIGLAAKNSILIVEFAEQLRERGMSIVDAAVESARIRLRPILMTSLAFILGVLPLAFATGAGAAGRNSIGTTVAGGMVASTILTIIFIPVLYVVIRTLAPGRGRHAREEDESGGSSPAAPGGHGAGAAGVALVLILCLIAPAGAQTTAAPAMEALSFDQAIARAIERNPNVAIAAANILRSQGLLQQIRSETMPRLTANITNTTLDQALAFGDSEVQPRNQTVMGLTASMPILAASQWAANAQARDRVEIAKFSSADTRRQVAVATAAAYLSVITQKRLVEIAERALETARSQFDYNRKRREGGLGSRLNELRAGQTVSVNETLAENFRLGLRRSQEALGVLVGGDAPIDTTSEPVFDISPSDSADDWLNARTDTRLLIMEQQAAQNVLKSGARDYLPQITMFFDPQYITPSGLFQRSKTWRLSFELHQDIYVGGGRKGLEVERKANLQTADFALVQRQIQARAEIRNARIAIEGYGRVLASARQAAEQANEVLKITITAFDAGASTNIEVIDAQRGARDIEAAVAQAEDSLRQAQFDLLVALGRFPK